MEFKESRVLFKFDENYWLKVIKYDDSKDYHKVSDSVTGTKGVDFVASTSNQIYLIEIKNYRSHRILSKSKIKELDLQLAQKVRDTLAGIVGGIRNSTHQQADWKHFLELLIDTECSLHILLWMEEDTPPGKLQKSARGIMSRRLKQRLSWLSSNVMVINKINNPLDEFLQAEFLPDT